MGGARLSSFFYNPANHPAIANNRKNPGRSWARIQEEVMEIEQVLDDYRNGDEDKRLCLFLTYRDLREELSLIDQEKALDQATIQWSPAFIHGKMIETLWSLFNKSFRRSKPCCCVAAGAGRPR
jgi:hypothetical protein